MTRKDLEARARFYSSLVASKPGDEDYEAAEDATRELLRIAAALEPKPPPEGT